MQPGAQNALPNEDLDAIVREVGPRWERLAGASCFITGGTGFFGIWLLESLQRANASLGLRIKATVLSRDPERFLARHPNLKTDSLAFVKGDIRTFALSGRRFDFAVHGAADTTAKAASDTPEESASIISDGTRRVLGELSGSGCRKLLFLSSGAVYGEQSSELSHVDEGEKGGPNPLDPNSAYGEAKRLAEVSCAIASARGDFVVSSARCFAFVGPYLPMEAHFAIGNFMTDALRGRDIVVKGDGTAYRSYLYASDLAAWLWTLLAEGQDRRAYNVGSENAVSIAELASLVAEVAGRPGTVKVLGTPDPTKPAKRYVPSTRRAREELGLRETVPLPQAVEKTLFWHRRNGTYRNSQL